MTTSTPSYQKALDVRDAGRVDAIGVPGRKHEEWRFVRLQHLQKPERYAAGQAPAADRLEAIRAALQTIQVEEAKGRLVVCYNGVFVEDLSDLGELGEGATLTVVSPDEAPEQLGKLTALVQDGKDYFTALNDEAWQQAIVLDVAPDSKAGCVHLVHVHDGTGSERVAITPRVLVQVGRGAKGSLVEEHISLSTDDGAGTLGIAAVEVSLQENARFDHVKHQALSIADDHVARAAVKVVEGAHYASVTFHLGAKLSRQDLHAEIAGGNTTCELHGLALIDGEQVSDTHSVMNHVHPHAHSDQVHKCVVGGKAHAVFNGKIFVREGAQQIDAFQLNRNLLLSNRAQVDTKPQLEILADDVKCSHGATIGQLDEDQVFYLQARGISADEARGLLTYAFAAELVERIPQLSLRKRLSRAILEKTQG